MYITGGKFLQYITNLLPMIQFSMGTGCHGSEGFYPCQNQKFKIKFSSLTTFLAKMFVKGPCRNLMVRIAVPSRLAF